MAKVVTAMMAGALAILIPTAAMADNGEVSVKVDVGAAVPLAQPQINGLGAGASGNVKLLYGIGPFFSLGPSASLTWLGSNPEVESSQTTFGAGVGARLSRPHGNDDHLTLFASPWVDGDFQLNKVGHAGEPIPSVSVGVGLSLPLTVDRSVWVSPFIRFEDVFAVPSDSSFDARENKIGSLGLSFEFGGRHLPPPPPAAPKVVEQPVAPPAVVVPPPPAPVAPTPAAEAPFVINEKIQFAFDSAALQSGSTSVLDEIAKNIQGHTNYSVTVRGYASSEGDLHYNQQLSLRRAQTVAGYLTSHSVDQNRVTAVGMGISNPVADNSTEAGRQLNRRVDFVTVVVTFTGNK
jgi:OmpA-OmpF porin, OOP family